ncbi:MAG: hypothetical protein DMG88_06175 [Acidobacteria bacterium]|nr:MAG: hypothetical protein DMG88_06175 [Acidobacteriota bacterium]
MMIESRSRLSCLILPFCFAEVNPPVNRPSASRDGRNHAGEFGDLDSVRSVSGTSGRALLRYEAFSSLISPALRKSANTALGQKGLQVGIQDACSGSR